MFISMGGSHCVSMNEGECYTWGGNDFGQLGDGTEELRPKPLIVLRQVIAVGAGWNHTLAATKYECFAWGSNSSGQLGDGTQIDRHVPVPVLDNARLVAGGMCHSVVVKATPGLDRHECFAWGASVSPTDVNASNRQLTGVGQLALLPEKMEGLLGVRRVAAGRNHSLAIVEGGDLFAWGRNASGQLGTGTTTNQPRPVRVMQGVRAAAAGLDYSLAVLRGGQLFGWGRNRSGQLGDGSTLDRHVPVKLLDGVRTVSAGYGHAVAILGNGDCVTWGRNVQECVCNAQEHPPAVVNILRPLRVLDNVSSVFVGESQSIAVSPSGECSVWGRNWSGICQSIASMGGKAELRRSPTGVPTGLGDLSSILVEDDNDDDIKSIYRQERRAKDAVSKDDSSLLWLFNGRSAESAEATETVISDEEGSFGEQSAIALDPKTAYKVAVETWVNGPVTQFGKDVHEKIHLRALVQGRAYAFRWSILRKSKFVDNPAESSTELAVPRSPSPTRSPGGVRNRSPKKLTKDTRRAQMAAELQRDRELLQQFHADLWKEIARFHHDQKERGPNKMANWPPEALDMHMGVLAVEKALRRAAKAVVRTEELFQEPPLAPGEKPGSKKPPRFRRKSV